MHEQDHPPSPTVRVREMAREEIDAVLRRNTVGRIAFSVEGRVDIEPIHYVYEDGVLYGRTSPGTMLSSVWRDPIVAFEVDEIEDALVWRSVVVHGGFHRVSRSHSDSPSGLYERAVDLLRRVVPGTFTDADPFPERTVVFRIPVHEVTGRAAAGRE